MRGLMLYTRYSIVARRAWPAFRPSASREQRYLAYKDYNVYMHSIHICYVEFLLQYCMQDTFARATHSALRLNNAADRPSDDRVSCIQATIL